MKKLIYTLLFTFIFGGLCNELVAQAFEIRVTKNDYGYLTVQMRETSGTGTPTTSTDIADISFEVRWLTTLSTDVAVICSGNDYNLADALGSLQTSGSYSYRLFQATNTPFNPPSNWVQNEWETLATFKSTSGSGSGDFEISPHTFGGYDLNWNQDGTDYLPTINGNASSYDYPTVIYDYVWTGSNSSLWDVTSNWETACGDAVAGLPTVSDNCLIPIGLSNYPNEYQAQAFNGAFACNNLRINNGATVTLDYLDLLSAQVLYNVSGDLLLYGTLYVAPNSQITISGSSYIDATTGLVIQSNATGTGSFIDNGTITYGTSGTAKVQTYLTNAATGTDFYIHQVGPTVNTTAGGGNGAVAEDFTIASGATYAYEWDEATTAWVNISQTAPVLAGGGIILSSTDGTNHTLELTGTLNTGTISPSITTGGSSLELLSNPYPSSIDFDALASSNSGVINDKYWIWDPSAGSYVPRASGVGGAQCVQVGQSFFVETVANGTFSFSNNERAHSNDPFRDVITDLLKITAHGGETSYLDRTYIRFDEDGTSGYDVNLESIHWASMYDDATVLKSVAEDDTKLAINVLPTLDIQGETVSVPLMFSCGYAGEYILSADNIDSFEADVEIWLEDKLNNNIWINFANNPDYHFTAQPNDDENRFAVHFFGPTSINETEIDNVTIYSSQQYAYIVNNSNEQISEIIIYDLNGRKVIDVLVSDQISYRQYVSDKTGYYVVRVITNKNVYTEKIFIQARR